jgi:hypothetical protein
MSIIIDEEFAEKDFILMDKKELIAVIEALREYGHKKNPNVPLVNQKEIYQMQRMTRQDLMRITRYATQHLRGD